MGKNGPLTQCGTVRHAYLRFLNFSRLKNDVTLCKA